MVNGLWLMLTLWDLETLARCSDSPVNLTYSVKVRGRLWSWLKDTSIDCWWEM